MLFEIWLGNLGTMVNLSRKKKNFSQFTLSNKTKHVPSPLCASVHSLVAYTAISYPECSLLARQAWRNEWLSKVPLQDRFWLFWKTIKYQGDGHSCPQRPRSFWSAPRIKTSGHSQHRKSAINGLIFKSYESDWLKTAERILRVCSKIGTGQRSREWEFVGYLKVRLCTHLFSQLVSVIS